MCSDGGGALLPPPLSCTHTALYPSPRPPSPLTHTGVDKVIFVGSTQVGKKVMAAASHTLTPVVLELGGKDAFIVCDDADIKSVVQVREGREM